MFMVYKVTGKRRSWLAEGKELGTQHGNIPLKPGRAKVNGETFVVVPAQYSDRVHGMKRSAQIITRKDIGYVIGYCALGKESVVVEAGAGSGGATVVLANVCKHVHSFDIRKDHLETVRKNLADLDVENVTLEKGDAYEGLPVEDADLFLLDVPEPWQAYGTAADVVKPGGFVVAYTPTIMQAREFVEKLPEDFYHEQTVEVIAREWNVRSRAVRPGNQPMGHTAFLTFCRRLD